ncbi:MAG: hypothetical protein ABJ092_13125 [Gillisia sp.]
MRLKIFALVISFTSIFFSCKEVTEPDPVTENPELDTKNSPVVENEIPVVEQDSLIRELPGNWRETEYPFRLAEFQDSQVKFIEEGIVEEPRFQEYKISGSCPFKVNNINDLQQDDLILVLIENKRCEKLKVTNDTLTLSGFNVNTGAEYHIVYKRAD